MVPPMVSSTRWVRIVPAPVIDRDSHFLWVTMIHTVAATVVLVAPKILWIINVRIVVIPIPVLSVLLSTPSFAIGPLSLWSLLSLTIGLLIGSLRV